MPIVQLENGEKLQFDDSYSDQQIAEAVDYYASGQAKPIEEAQQPQQKSMQDQQPPAQEETFNQANRRRLGEFAKGIPQGLGNIAVGAVQAATDLGEGAARGIEKAIYGDNALEPNSKSNFGGRLAESVRQRNAEQAKLPTSERVGIVAGQTAPFLPIGSGLGLVKGAAASGAALSALSPKEEAGFQNRAVDTVEDAGVSALTAGGIKLGGALASKTIDLAKPVAKYVGAKFSPSRAMREELSAEKAVDMVKTGLKKEGISADELLQKMEQNGTDIIDEVDPRFRLATQGKALLNRRGTIQIADQSLKKINETTDKVKDAVLDMVSLNKITPEEAGVMLGRNAKKIISAELEARRLQAAPLYKEGEKGFAKLDQVIADDLEAADAAALGLKKGQTKLTLNDLLQSPIIKESINIARSKSQEFSKTLGAKIYGNIYAKTDPITRVRVNDVYDVSRGQKALGSKLNQEIDNYADLKDSQRYLEQDVRANAKAGALINADAQQKLGFFRNRARAEGNKYIREAAGNARALDSVRGRVSAAENSIKNLESNIDNFPGNATREKSIDYSPPQYQTPDHAIKVLSAVDKILYAKIGEIAQSGNTAEQAALKLARKGLHKVLDEANPALTQARKIYKSETETLEELGQSSVGMLAKKFDEKKFQALAKDAQDVLRLPPERIKQIRAQNPSEFNDLARNSLENQIAKITPAIDGVIKPNAFNKAFFEKNPGALRAVLGDDKVFVGFKKLANALDVKFERGRIVNNAAEAIARNSKIPTGKFTIINRALEGSYNAVVNNPMAQKKFVEFMFTEAGREALRKIALEPEKQVSKKLINDFLIKAVAINASNQN